MLFLCSVKQSVTAAVSDRRYDLLLATDYRSAFTAVITSSHIIVKAVRPDFVGLFKSGTLEHSQISSCLFTWFCASLCLFPAPWFSVLDVLPSLALSSGTHSIHTSVTHCVWFLSSNGVRGHNNSFSYSGGVWRCIEKQPVWHTH